MNNAKCVNGNDTRVKLLSLEVHAILNTTSTVVADQLTDQLLALNKLSPTFLRNNFRCYIYSSYHQSRNFHSFVLMVLQNLQH